MSALPVRSKKMEALGTMAGGIAHDLNSMLVPIMGYGELTQQCVGEGRTDTTTTNSDPQCPTSISPRSLHNVEAVGELGLS
jgi:hypothetical protein